jgi:hypothetical protein
VSTPAIHQALSVTGAIEKLEAKVKAEIEVQS